MNVGRNLRFLVACGAGANGADLVVSSFHPDQGMVEVMAWDEVTGGFNLYRTMPDTNAWVFAGNSRHALAGPSRGSGPFESHVNGNIVMKELKTPWVHWHSPFAVIQPSALASQGFDTHPWVARLHPGGAYTLEDNVVKPGIVRWPQARAAAIVVGTAEETPARMLEQVLRTLTVNLVSSFTRSADASSQAVPEVDVPATFFADADMFRAVGLAAEPPLLRVNSRIYADTFTSFNVRLTDGPEFTQSGDTHFAFVVPERAFEDVATINAALDAGLLTRRLVAALSMVDFTNPVFSPRRDALVTHLAAVPWNGDGQGWCDAVGDAIATSPQAATPDSPEAEFAQAWAAGENFAAVHSAKIAAFYDAVQAALGTADGFADVYRLAESRRQQVRKLPIFESPLVFSTSDVGLVSLTMRPDATVVDAPVVEDGS